MSEAMQRQNSEQGTGLLGSTGPLRDAHVTGRSPSDPSYDQVYAEANTFLTDNNRLNDPGFPTNFEDCASNIETFSYTRGRTDVSQQEVEQSFCPFQQPQTEVSAFTVNNEDMLSPKPTSLLGSNRAGPDHDMCTPSA